MQTLPLLTVLIDVAVAAAHTVDDAAASTIVAVVTFALHTVVVVVATVVVAAATAYAVAADIFPGFSWVGSLTRPDP